MVLDEELCWLTQPLPLERRRPTPRRLPGLAWHNIPSPPLKVNRRKCGKCKGRTIIKTIDTFQNNFRFSLFTTVNFAQDQHNSGSCRKGRGRVRRLDFYKFGLSSETTIELGAKSAIKLNMQMVVKYQLREILRLYFYSGC